MKNVDKQKFLKKFNILSGIGKSQVLTKGTFKHDLVIDEDYYSLTWHVVPTKHLNFEAIIGTDILEQASLKFTEEGVEFHKYEGGNYQVQKESIRPEAKGSIQEFNCLGVKEFALFNVSFLVLFLFLIVYKAVLHLSVNAEIAISRKSNDADIPKLIKASESEEGNVPEYENHISDENESNGSDNDFDIDSHQMHTIQNNHSQTYKIWSKLDTIPHSSQLMSANIRTTPGVTRYAITLKCICDSIQFNFSKRNQILKEEKNTEEH
ncbi:uncharacterized protein NPIL_159901 [Nephila pilipes]|uniref:Uncharacterized protein n=1 Tax=Nephila pilipes TaxID=299642 RepID=A0A8X6NMB2_NEPPI|nr:uncharacterized protein NPIL_159901 [Nephila pilipes]